MFDNDDDATTEGIYENSRKTIRTNAQRQLKASCPKLKLVSAKAKKLIKLFGEAGQEFGVSLNHIDYTAAVATDKYVLQQKKLIDYIQKLEYKINTLTPEPDQYCVTREDGECISNHPKCMHNKHST